MLKANITNEIYNNFLIITVSDHERLYYSILDNKLNTVINGSGMYSGLKTDHEAVITKLKNKIDEYLRYGDIKEE